MVERRAWTSKASTLYTFKIYSFIIGGWSISAIDQESWIEKVNIDSFKNEGTVSIFYAIWEIMSGKVA